MRSPDTTPPMSQHENSGSCGSNPLELPQSGAPRILGWTAAVVSGPADSQRRVGAPRHIRGGAAALARVAAVPRPLVGGFRCIAATGIPAFRVGRDVARPEWVPLRARSRWPRHPPHDPAILAGDPHHLVVPTHPSRLSHICSTSTGYGRCSSSRCGYVVWAAWIAVSAMV